METFRSPDFGALGYVDANKVSIYRSTTKRHTMSSEFDVSGRKSPPSVEIVYSYVEPGATVIQALAASGVQGIVFAGTGAGLISHAEKVALEAALAAPGVAKPVMVRSSRVGSGRVIASAEYDAMGMIPADTLNPQKARILLMLAPTVTADLGEIRWMFGEY